VKFITYCGFSAIVSHCFDSDSVSPMINRQFIHRLEPIFITPCFDSATAVMLVAGASQGCALFDIPLALNRYIVALQGYCYGMKR
jgi:hypothetical protein